MKVSTESTSKRHPNDLSEEQEKGPDEPKRGGLARWMLRWFFANTLISGLMALAWLVLRSGPNPSRLAYPCQQAAFATAVAAFGVPLATAIVSLRHRFEALRATRWGTFATAGLVMCVVGFGAVALDPTGSGYNDGPRLTASPDYRAAVYVVDDAGVIEGDHMTGLDDLIAMMGEEGLAFYESRPALSMEASPDGVVSADDVVLIKINYQWDQRGGTNTDLLKSLIRRIVDHPDGFTGEVVVVENAQFASTEAFDRAQNNAEDKGQSPHDVVASFEAKGYAVSHFDWTLLRTSRVDEFDEGNNDDGYVVSRFKRGLKGRASYPKFTTDAGTPVSLRWGVWDENREAYNRDQLTFINLPVLKSHSATYGATASVKHYMGLVTGRLGTNSHNAIRNGILGEVIGTIGLADLNILDCIWVNGHPNRGPDTSYTDATRVDMLLASQDPVALDRWAVENVLIPTFEANGYQAPWPQPSADPVDPTSDFRIYLDNSMEQILAAGFDVTNDLNAVDVYR